MCTCSGRLQNRKMSHEHQYKQMVALNGNPTYCDWFLPSHWAAKIKRKENEISEYTYRLWLKQNIQLLLQMLYLYPLFTVIAKKFHQDLAKKVERWTLWCFIQIWKSPIIEAAEVFFMWDNALEMFSFYSKRPWQLSFYKKAAFPYGHSFILYPQSS